MKHHLFLFLLFIPLLCFGKSAPRDMQLFNANMDTVQWLCFYDYIAWATSDSVMRLPEETKKKLGQEWFCMPDIDGWHAYYGKLIDDKYEPVIHYLLYRDRTIKRIHQTEDTARLTCYAKALHTSAMSYIPATEKYGMKWNQYIQQNEDLSFRVFILPALQINNLALYGIEFIYTISPDGNTILTDNSYKSNLQGFFTNSDQEIWVNYTKLKEPTIGALFFCWYFRTYFKGINLEMKKYLHAPISMGDYWQWMSIEKKRKK